MTPAVMPEHHAPVDVDALLMEILGGRINKSRPVPLYFQLAGAIDALIRDGTLRPGRQLPGETQLCRGLRLSRPTVHRALTQLVSRGVVDPAAHGHVIVASPSPTARSTAMNPGDTA